MVFSLNDFVLVKGYELVFYGVTEWHMRGLMQMAWSESVSSPHLHSVKHKIIKKNAKVDIT